MIRCKYKNQNRCALLEDYLSVSPYIVTDVWCNERCGHDMERQSNMLLLFKNYKKPDFNRGPVNFAELKIPASVASTRLNICGQVCGGLRDKTKCPIGITPCQIKSGKVTECPLDKWPKTPHQ
jgi:hypothetical protein